MTLAVFVRKPRHVKCTKLQASCAVCFMHNTLFVLKAVVERMHATAGCGFRQIQEGSQAGNNIGCSFVKILRLGGGASCSWQSLGQAGYQPPAGSVLAQLAQCEPLSGRCQQCPLTGRGTSGAAGTTHTRDHTSASAGARSCAGAASKRGHDAATTAHFGSAHPVEDITAGAHHAPAGCGGDSR